jgi:hydroxyethylthiazole kinase-like uncharacterized protein yjeF
MQNSKTPVYQTVQIREFERLAQQRFSITGEVMMNRAGKAAADFLLRRWPQAKKITVFCGGGNNGGDGYVLAQQLRERNLEVVILQVGNQDHMKEDASNALAACKQAKIEITSFSYNIPMSLLTRSAV